VSVLQSIDLTLVKIAYLVTQILSLRTKFLKKIWSAVNKQSARHVFDSYREM